MMDSSNSENVSCEDSSQMPKTIAKATLTNNKELTLDDCETVMMVYSNATSMQEVKMEKHLKPLAKEFKLMKPLRGKDKSTFIKAISQYLLDEGLVEVKSKSVLSRDDVKVCKKL
ncbi:uncharacterized protein LOC114576166 [Exaiptasia diaphana]|uniref:Uncharacterized protein n=1 Tax=Exaiptasia diaphana TaxID=2652724 RepID=A0A913YRL0_EXADI|nr:uncharacterized protein LOC114576166 [Exaiptasia diaphana]